MKGVQESHKGKKKALRCTSGDPAYPLAINSWMSRNLVPWATFTMRGPFAGTFVGD